MSGTSPLEKATVIWLAMALQLLCTYCTLTRVLCLLNWATRSRFFLISEPSQYRPTYLTAVLRRGRPTLSAIAPGTPRLSAPAVPATPAAVRRKVARLGVDARCCSCPDMTATSYVLVNARREHVTASRHHSAAGLAGRVRRTAPVASTIRQWGG